jgi:hypothetical protein
MLLALNYATASGQVKIGDNATNVNTASLLELESTTKGLLLPRLTTAQIHAMSNVPKGMLVFNSTDSALFVKRDTGWAVLALASGSTSVDNKWAANGNHISNLNSGNVGIGTPNPLAQLHVQGPESSVLIGRLSDEPRYSGISTNGSLSLDNFTLLSIPDKSLVFNRPAGGRMQFWWNGQRLDMTLSADGNLGIGTGLPGEKLDVQGVIKGVRGRFGSFGATAMIGQWDASSSYAGISMNGSLASTDYNLLSGNVDRNLFINRPAGRDMLFRMNNADQMTLLANGNFGIGNSAPAEKLEVAGNIKYSGDLMVGLQYVFRQDDLAARTSKEYFMVCPVGTRLIGGGGGHRDFNAPALDINVRFSGPDPPTNAWRIVLSNNNPDFSRAVIFYAICAKVR